MLEDVIRAERAEQEIDAFVTRRALKTNPEQKRIEDGWEETTRRYNAKHREARLWERLAFHRAQLERHSATFDELLRRHRVGIRLVEQALGITSEEERKSA